MLLLTVLDWLLVLPSLLVIVMIELLTQNELLRTRDRRVALWATRSLSLLLLFVLPVQSLVPWPPLGLRLAAAAALHALLSRRFLKRHEVTSQQQEDILAHLKQPTFAVITGVSLEGIGFHVCIGLLRKGCTLLVVDRMPSAALEKIGAALCNEANVPRARVATHTLDLGDTRACKAFVDEIKARRDVVDILLLNAGHGAFEVQTPPDRYPNIFSAHLLGHALLAFGLAPLLERSNIPGGPRVVFTSSIAAEMFTERFVPSLALKLGAPELVGFPSYARAKLCVNLFALRFARAYPSVRVCTWAPGIVATPIWLGDRRHLYPYVAPLFEFLLRHVKDAAMSGIYYATTPHPSSTLNFYDFEGPSFGASYLGKDEAMAEDLWCFLAEVAVRNGIAVTGSK